MSKSKLLLYKNNEKCFELCIGLFRISLRIGASIFPGIVKHTSFKIRNDSCPEFRVLIEENELPENMFGILVLMHLRRKSVYQSNRQGRL